MNITIYDSETLINRLNEWIKTMEYVLENKRDDFWKIHEAVKGKVITHSIKWSKDLFKTNCIDRYKKALEAIETNNLHNVDWIDYRDVLYSVCFDIDMLNEVSFKALRQSNKDLTIRLKGNKEKFEGFIKYQKQFV